jgi:multidrug efflux pump subunit AcrA (membrane-fusion protein)
MNTDETHRRAEALFKKGQQLRGRGQAMTEYQTELQATREKTARLRALRLARDATNPRSPRPVKQKGAT